MSEEFIHVVTATATRDEARKIAGALVEQHLAACVQIVGPIESTFRWKGKIETQEEWQCWIKTRRLSFDKVRDAIAKLHSYEVPEILAMPIVESNQAYLKWLGEETT